MTEQFKISDIATADLVPFAEHTFKQYEGKKFDALANSVKESGVLVPVIVRPQGKKYEILSGHNRIAAAKFVGLPSVPAVVRKDLTDDEARLIVTVTNLIQRSFADLSHSERAAALTAHYNAVKNQGKRTDLIDSINMLLGVDDTSVAVRQKLSARDIVAKTYGLGGTMVAQYLRVEQLIDALKKLLDDGKISLRAAVELSYLSQDTQTLTNEILKDSECRIEVKTASELRSAEVDGVLEPETARRIIQGTSVSRQSAKSVKVKNDVFARYFTGEQSDDDISDTIEQALEAWFAANR
jgi:ParB family chromosome partitioning protein